MKRDNLLKAMAEADKFIRLGNELLAKTSKEDNLGFSYNTSGLKESSAVKRASMELTRSLSKMRSRE